MLRLKTQDEGHNIGQFTKLCTIFSCAYSSLRAFVLNFNIHLDQKCNKLAGGNLQYEVDLQWGMAGRGPYFVGNWVNL